MAPAISTHIPTDSQDLGALLKQHEGLEKAAASSVSTLRGRVIDLVARVRRSQEDAAAVAAARALEQERARALRDAVADAASENHTDAQAVRAALQAALAAFENQTN